MLAANRTHRRLYIRQKVFNASSAFEHDQSLPATNDIVGHLTNLRRELHDPEVWPKQTIPKLKKAEIMKGNRNLFADYFD